MHKENDYIVYRHDVCLIKEITKIKNEDYYILVPLRDTSLKMSTPVSNKLGLIRDVISKDEALKLIESIKDIMPLENINDKYIENTYKELLNEGTHEGLIKIIKTSYLRNESRLNNNKKIGEKDKNYFDKAEEYLYNELKISLNMDIDDIKNMIKEKCN